MKIIKISQSNDRESWLDLRRGVVTSTKAKEVKPASRGNSLPAGIYELLAEKLAIAKDGEPERDRGLRLENEALLLTQEKYNLDFELDAGMWFSDDMKLAVSPDASQVGDKPTYAGEAKCLDTKNHLRAILNDYEAKKLPGYNPLSSLKIGKSDFTAQVLQYFVVNKDLEILYFTLYDDRVVLENIMHYVIIVERKDVTEFVDGQELYERDALAKVNQMIKILKGIK
jgi:hypothetical protein